MNFPRWLDWTIAVALFLLVAGVYAPVRHYGFVNYDDYFYVTQNSHVLSGLNSASVRWAFTATESANWHPLTWISLMADRQFFASPEEVPPSDIRAGAHHVVNVLLHALSTALLFGLFVRMTGARGPSLLAALIFGLHPLHVESVAWVSERKDVLSGLFWMLALHAWVSYTARPRATRYLLALLLCCLGCLAKPMVVTLPLVLVLLDIWPLRRSAAPAMRRLVWEKLPFYAVAAAVSLITYSVQKQAGAMRTFGDLWFGARLANALVSAAVYIGKLLWPARLAALYPLTRTQPAWQVALAALVLAAITALALRTLPTKPWLAIGWFWYLVTVLPVIGFVQVGMQARADRYTYLPGIGLAMMLAWSAADAWRAWPKARPAIAGACAAASLAWIVLTARQIPYWRSSVALFEHAIEVTGPNPFAHVYLGNSWREQVMYDQAIAEYRKGLGIAPRNVVLLVDLGAVLGEAGRMTEAIAPLGDAVGLEPGDPVIRTALGEALATTGRAEEALPQLQEALRLRPDLADAHAWRGVALERTGHLDDAIAEFSEALRIQPNHAAARQNLREALAQQGRH